MTAVVLIGVCVFVTWARTVGVAFLTCSGVRQLLILVVAGA